MRRPLVCILAGASEKRGITMAEELLRKCQEEEQKYQFDRFNQTDAKKLGDLLYEKSLAYPKPVAIEITINHLLVYRFYPEGTNRNNERWLAAKANTVEMLGISSLHYFASLEASGETPDDRRMPEAEFAACGGGFPLRIKGCANVGSICVSGLPHMQDHQVIIDALAEYFGNM